MSDLEDCIRELIEIEPSEFEDEILGYNCNVWRNNFGAYCGYVTILDSHPLVKECGNSFLDQIDCLIEVHGGVTYHERVDGGYMIGFDTAHYCDYVLYNNRISVGYPHPSNYRHFDYVWAQLQNVCIQLQFYAEKLG